MVFGFPKLAAALTLVAYTALQGWGFSTANACGLDWNLPINHFDGVDDHGYVAYWEKIGEVDCGDGLKLPLHINFNSGRDAGAPSPYLGQGWILPILECKFVQESEDRFVMTQPDGLKNLFLRAEANGSVLNGSAGWKGEIKGETITAWGPCGWKIVFVNGHITSITNPKGRQLEWMYDAGLVTEVREGNTTRLKVEYGTDSQATALTLPTGQSISISQEKKPRIQIVGGQNIIVGVNKSLARLISSDGQERHYDFSVDENTLPTLKVFSKEQQGAVVTRSLTWDPKTKLILRDGDWKYQIKPPRQDGSIIDFVRQRISNSRTEAWYKDDSKGEEITQDESGARTVVYRYTGGTLSGFLRKKEYYKNDKLTFSEGYSYDENGWLIRSTTSDGLICQYNQQHNLSRIVKQGKLLLEVEYEGNHAVHVKDFQNMLTIDSKK